VPLPSITSWIQHIYAIIPSFLLMTETTPIELVYDGEDVQGGILPVEYMIDALVGFSSAYAKVARRSFGEEIQHNIRVVGLKDGSARILIDVFEYVTKNPGSATVFLTGATVVGGAAYRVVTDIGKYIAAKKHTKGKRPKRFAFRAQGTVDVFNDSDEPIELTKEQFEFLESRLLDHDVEKMTAPLDNEKVDLFKLRRGRDDVLAEVNHSERPFFIGEERTVTTTKDDIWLEGTLNSFAKDKNRGTFYTLSGKHISYHYIGQDEQELLSAFAHKGVVRVQGRVSFDEDLEPIHIDIKRVERRQKGFFDQSRV
jgi:hypothetical protein